MKFRLSYVLVSAISVLVTFVVTFCCFHFFLYPETNTPFFQTFSEIRGYVDENSVVEYSPDEAEKAAINGFLSALNDPYVQYWDKEEYAAYLSESQGNYAGLGITIRSDDPISEKGILVYRVLEDSPAESAGVRSGDSIVAINGQSLIGTSYQAAYESLGIEMGKSVTITLRRGEETLDAVITANHFVQKYVESRMIDTTAYIRIHLFMDPAFAEFQNALNELLKNDPQGLIVDLRNNPGGSLSCVASIVDLLVEKGEEIVVLRYKDEEDVLLSQVDPKTDVPIVVLVNEGSASASELMASALRDLADASIVGTTTVGKGVGQTSYPLENGGAVKFTTFHYLTKSRTEFNGVGLSPDVTVDLTEEQKEYFYSLTDSEDAQLQAALAALKG